MNLIIFTHPTFIGSQSMPRYARMLAEGMSARGHRVECWTAKAFFYNWPVPCSLKKWMGYLDQFILFPIIVKKRLKSCDDTTLFVFADQALGPWIPLVAHRKHVIHCHDFLAQRSASGELKENPVGWTGRLYQAYIRKGYRQGCNFISISEKTRQDLHRFLKRQPAISEVVYNGLNQTFSPGNPQQIRNLLSDKLGINLHNGYLLHVGGNQFYKNRLGVLEIYKAWRSNSNKQLPLLMIGSSPSARLIKFCEQSGYNHEIHFLEKIGDPDLRLAYQGASVFLFPSLAEGFGWPIAEAMASGCPVVTTNEAPMTEVAGDAGYLIPRMPNNLSVINHWAKTCAVVLNQICSQNKDQRDEEVNKGLENAKRFDPIICLERIEQIYLNIVNQKK
ncbi:glycosyltransferase family 4 protein [Paludibacter jiangxiensis]|uniref:Glycosyltransferase n=1 Tax=Paludibacter jiangxiensis TaxID=681398 RepID=A0A161LER8_9BACT|nr:glycosyltransferase family 1 protein [Paludibacter jiangxiensis]GAT63255.1 glycosyltransferase [Paludibacter jiangxiensis]